MYTINEIYALAWLDMNTITLFSMIGSLFYLKNHYTLIFQKSRFRLETLCGTSEQLLFNSQLVNSTIHSVDVAKANLQRNLLSLIQIAESCIVWLIHTYKSTWRCLLHLAVQLVLSLVTQIAEPAQNIIQGVSSILHLPTSTNNNWTQSLNSVQSKIDQWFENDKDIIFKTINPLFQNLQSHVNSTLETWQPPPFQISASPFSCDTTQLNHAMDTVENEINATIGMVMGGVVALLLICILVNIVIARFRYNRVVQAHALFLKQVTTREPSLQLDRYLWSSYTLLPWQKRNTRLHRFIHFINHPMVVYCGLFGIGGLCLTFLVGYLLETKVNGVFDAAIDGLTMNTTATQQLHELNEWVNKAELGLNQHVFGIIKSFAVTINDTLANVVNEIQNFIHSVLGGTLLETPVQGLTECLIINKIESVEQGLTWIASILFKTYIKY